MAAFEVITEATDNSLSQSTPRRLTGVPQLTRHSSFQSLRGTVLASGAVP